MSKALVSVLRTNAIARRKDPVGYITFYAGIADTFDPVLAQKIRAICNAEKDLDDYILSRSEDKVG